MQMLSFSLLVFLLCAFSRPYHLILLLYTPAQEPKFVKV